MSGTAGKLALCYGTRPQVVKASVLLDALGQDWEVKAVDTGQHYDWEMNGVHYSQLGVRAPDLCLEVGSSDHARQTAEILVRAAAEFRSHRPDVVVVVGDTNSTLGCALAAAKLRIPVVHVEAGLRAQDLQMPEEINRRVVDEVSVLLCAPSRRAEAYLAARASAGQVVAMTGDVSRDVLERALRHPERPLSPWTEVLVEPPYVLATLHRAELTQDPHALGAALGGLGGMGLPVLFMAHPRTVEAMSGSGLSESLPDNVLLRKPVGYLEMVSWTSGAEVVVTDSGGLQREAYWLRVPCITLRGETEWVETLEEGANVLVRPDRASALSEAWRAHPGRTRSWPAAAFGDGSAGEAVRQAVQNMFRRQGLSA